MKKPKTVTADQLAKAVQAARLDAIRRTLSDLRACDILPANQATKAKALSYYEAFYGEVKP